MNQQLQNNPNRTDSSPIHHRGLNAFYWYQAFALESVVVEPQMLFKNNFKLHQPNIKVANGFDTMIFQYTY